MSNFDDIFDTPVQQEQANQPDAPFDKEAWKEKKQTERNDAYERIDRTAETLVTDGNIFQTYLDVQSRFDRYSVGNALLIMERNPQAKKLGDVDYWKSQGGFIKRSQFDKPIIILEPGNEYTREDGSVGVSYNTKRVYDIAQTTVREKTQPAVHRDERTLIRALIHNAPVTIQSVAEINGTNRGAMLDPEQGAIFVRKGMDAPDIFRSIANELAHAEFAGGDPAYDRDANAFKAYCASYMLCKRSGIDTKGYDFSTLPDTLQVMDAQEIRGELSQVRDAAGDISSRMAKVLEQGKSARQQGHER